MTVYHDTKWHKLLIITLDTTTRVLQINHYLRLATTTKLHFSLATDFLGFKHTIA